MDEKITPIGGLNVHIIHTDKYKTNTLVLKMKAPLTRGTVTQRALLPYVLQSGTKSYPSTSSLRSYLDELYGASLNVDLTKKGESHIITIRIDIANEKFLRDATPLLKKAIELLSEIVHEPATENHMFLSKIVEQEKRALKQRIQAACDDKMRYANMRLVEEMYAGEPYALHANGVLEDVDAITARDLYEYYKKSLLEDEVDLYVIGDVNESEVIEMAKSHFRFESRTTQPSSQTANKKSISKVNTVVEQQDVKQGKLNIGYRTKITYDSDKYYALQVFNGIFGGFAHSKLFLNVREKASLAYYAASRLESHQGLLMVMSGIEPGNYEKAVNIINEQMEAMKNGQFTDGEIEQTKAVIHNQLLETLDTPRGLVEVLYHNVVSSRNRSIDEWLEAIEAVTRDEIVSVAKDIELDTIYFLTRMEAEQ